MKNLGQQYDSDDKLRALFAPIGYLTYAKVKTDKRGRPKDYGLVSMADNQMAMTAFKILNRLSLGSGRYLVATYGTTSDV